MVLGLAVLLTGCEALFPTGSLPGGYDASRLGALSDEGILIGEGHLQGVDRWGVAVDMDWQILAYPKDGADPDGVGRQACTTWVFAGRWDVDATCSSITTENGLPGVGLSTGSPTIIYGLLNPWTSEVRVELTDGEFVPRLVPLDRTGLQGSGFALVLIGPDAFVAVREYDARGRLLREHRQR
jgi:hypothetical protein